MLTGLTQISAILNTTNANTTTTIITTTTTTTITTIIPTTITTRPTQLLSEYHQERREHILSTRKIHFFICHICNGRVSITHLIRLQKEFPPTLLSNGTATAQTSIWENIHRGNQENLIPGVMSILPALNQI